MFSGAFSGLDKDVIKSQLLIWVPRTKNLIWPGGKRLDATDERHVYRPALEKSHGIRKKGGLCDK